MSEELCSINGCRLKEYDNKKCILHCDKNNWYTIDKKENKNWNKSKNSIKKFWIEIKEQLNNIWYAKEHGYENTEEIIYTKVVFPQFEISKKQLNDFGDLVSLGRNFYYRGHLEYREYGNYPDGFNSIFNDLYITFKGCKFLDDSTFSEYFFKKEIKFINCIFEKNVNFSSMKFENKFKFINCRVLGESNFEKTKFNSLVGFEKTKFYKTNFINVKFYKIVRFMETEFNENIDFRHTYFYEKVIFNEMIIKQKINLEKAIFFKSSNFYNLKFENNCVSNRETARIIKDSFELQNNIIEGNKFYSLEMKEREQELEKDKKNGKNLFEWLIFKIHGISSNHSQDWTVALFWIITIGLFGSLCNFYSKDNFVNFSFTSMFGTLLLISIAVLLNYIFKPSKKIEYGFLLFNFYLIYGYKTGDILLSDFAKNLNPFSIMDVDYSITLGTLVFKIIITYLIYQLIISIRQNTRRK